MHLQRGFGSNESGNLQTAEGLPWRDLQSGVNTLANTDITSITGDIPYHGRSDAIEKRLRFSKVSADLLIELTDIEHR